MKRLSKEKRKASMENPEFRWVHIYGTWMKKRNERTGEMLEGGFVLDWGAKNIGFGTITFKQKTRNGDATGIEIECESERMGADFVRKALEHFAKTVKIVE